MKRCGQAAEERVKWVYPALRQDERQAKPSNSDLSVLEDAGNKVRNERQTNRFGVRRS